MSILMLSIKGLPKVVLWLENLDQCCECRCFEGCLFSPIQRHLSYGIIVWGHSGNIRKMWILQNIAIRSMLKVNVGIYCKPLSKELKF